MKYILKNADTEHLEEVIGFINDSYNRETGSKVRGFLLIKCEDNGDGTYTPEGFSQTRYAYEYYGQNIHYLRFMFGPNFESGLGLEFTLRSGGNIQCRYFSAPK